MEKINISEIQIIPIKPKEGLVGFVSFVINECFYVGNIALYSSLSSPLGFRLVYPTKMGVSCFHPIKREIGELIQNQVTSRYLEIIEKLRRSENLSE